MFKNYTCPHCAYMYLLKKKSMRKNAYTDVIQKTNQTINKLHNIDGLEIQKLDHSVIVNNFSWSKPDLLIP